MSFVEPIIKVCTHLTFISIINRQQCRWTHTHNRLTALCPGLPGRAGTRMVKPIWILLKQETMSGSGISWAICKSALLSRQIAILAPHPSVFYRLDALPAAQPTASMHWRQYSADEQYRRYTENNSLHLNIVHKN